MVDPILFNGTVDWSGENPGISLKETPDGPFVVLASFFRVVLSPHGRGHVLVLLQSPHEANAPAERGNYCLHDNETLGLDSVEASGDPASTYSETVRAGDLDVRLTWTGRRSRDSARRR